MSEAWYYVLKGNRLGPVDFKAISVLVAKDELGHEDFVWKKGFDGWKKVKEVSELLAPQKIEIKKEETAIDLPPVLQNKPISLKSLSPDDKVIFIRIGYDRGENPVEYGPYSIDIIKKLFEEKRINGKTEFFAKGMLSWQIFADNEDFEEVFQEAPPKILPTDKRQNQRKPFVARMFIQNNKKLYEGICRDISIGGMQVLVDEFPGASGDRIAINVHPENSEHHFVANGVIVRILEGNAGFSFRFMNLNNESKSAIENYISASE
jgi:hypothetical protein